VFGAVWFNLLLGEGRLPNTFAKRVITMIEQLASTHSRHEK
jgi:hypothetical protein